MTTQPTKDVLGVGTEMSSRSSLTCCAGGARGKDYESKKATLNKLIPLLREQALSVRYVRCLHYFALIYG